MNTNRTLCLVFVVASLHAGCGAVGEQTSCDPEKLWRRSWSLMLDSVDGRDQLQSYVHIADSLIHECPATIDSVPEEFIIDMSLVLLLSGDTNRAKQILSAGPNEVLNRIGGPESPFRSIFPVKEERPTDPELQAVLAGLHYKDQAVRGNVQRDLIREFKLTDTLYIGIATATDRANRLELDSIIRTRGFPTREQVGFAGTNFVFFVIQHADADTAWQAAMLDSVRAAAEAGDIDRGKLAYLIDRVEVNRGSKQVYGTQFQAADNN